MINSFNQQQFNTFKKERYNEIYRHELAHKRAGGAMAGAIVIEKDENGVPYAGHVAIKMPALSKENPSKTINQAQTVIKSAMAPANPSEQDYKVAAEARQILEQAQILKKDSSKSGSKLDIQA